jgi:anaerobic selenocysteine-containing dehydrogenase
MVRVPKTKGGSAVVKVARSEDPSGLRVEPSYCRICAGACGVLVTIDANDHIVDIRGDKSSPMTKGYACFKGLQAEEAHHGPARLTHSLKRNSEGGLDPIPSAQALDEIAAKMRLIRDRNGPDALGLFMGTAAYGCSLFYAMHRNFMAAMGSRSLFTVSTIDQSAKYVSFERQGGWAAGIPDLDEIDVLMLFGNNPLVSHYAGNLMSSDATRRMKAAKARGLKLICIDPRRHETARHADVFLQPIPGQDPAILAGMLRIIFSEGWEDREFCAAHVDPISLARLRTAVQPFTSGMVERRAHLEPGKLMQATKLFAHEHRTGVAFAGTGPCMSPFSNLTQHLVDTLNIVCGRFRKAGDPYRPDPQLPYVAAHAEVIPPARSWEKVPPSRIHSAGSLFGERPTSTLAEEILRPGEGQVRSMLVMAGNPISCVPDQRRMVTAMQDLELLVVVDPHLTSTASYADYVIAPTLQYEHPDLPYNVMGWNLYPDCWCRYTPAILKPPPASDVIDDWYVLWGLASRLGVQLSLNGVDLNMQRAPTSDELIDIKLRGSLTSLEELKRYPNGKIFADPRWRVLPGRPEAAAHRFDVMSPDVEQELESFLQTECTPGQIVSNGRAFTHFLTTRRRRDYYNSIGQFLSRIQERNPRNPAFLNPADMEQMDLREGDQVRIESDHGQILATVEPDPTIRTGVVSMSHGCGGLPDPNSPYGDMVGVLISTQRDLEAINGQPRMSAIPVNIHLVSRGPVSIRATAQKLN